MRRILSALVCIVGLVVCVASASSYAETTLDFVRFDGNITKSNYEKMIVNYCKIPLNVREHLQLAGWNIILTSSRLEDIFPEWKDNTICALTDPVADEIWIEDSQNGVNAIIHEVGHYVACSCEELSRDATDEWYDIWNEEKKSISKYARTNTAEGFAEAFKQCILDSEAFQNRCPKSYAYVTAIYTELEGVQE